MEYVQCDGINKHGIRCQRVILKTSTPCYCFDHILETDEQRQEKLMKMTRPSDKNIDIELFNNCLRSRLRGMRQLLLQTLSCGSIGYARQMIKIYLDVHRIKRDTIIDLFEMSKRGYSIVDSDAYKSYMHALEAFQCQDEMQAVAEINIMNLFETLIYVGQVYNTDNFYDIRMIVRNYFGYKSFSDIFGDELNCKDIIAYYNAPNQEATVNSMFELERVIDSLDELRFFY
jgi:hypothetical protein